MKKAALFALFCMAFMSVSAPSWAHHSFASWDLEKDVHFEGVVDKLDFRNPHMSMTLIETKPDGTQVKVNFAEGAPANMLIRLGLKPNMIKPGTKIKVIGSPRKDNPNVYFLKTIILEDGTTFATLGGPKKGAKKK
ncbi:MAG TPA: DUF6152 family protein [Alphaproteobacteria bacterium]|nr:DUF6152 family protein [Alphaproteobacteria bacterium]